MSKLIAKVLVSEKHYRRLRELEDLEKMSKKRKLSESEHELIGGGAENVTQHEGGSEKVSQHEDGAEIAKEEELELQNQEEEEELDLIEEEKEEERKEGGKEEEKPKEEGESSTQKPPFKPSIRKNQIEKASQLMSFLIEDPSISWNAVGELSINKEIIPRSNISDLFSSIFLPGFGQFHKKLLEFEQKQQKIHEKQ